MRAQETKLQSPQFGQDVWEIFCPNRVGDCLMSLPAIICLSLLVPSSVKLVLINNKNISSLLFALNLLPVKTYSSSQKYQSWFQPKAKAVFLNSQSQHQFYRAKQTLGWPNKGKAWQQLFIGYNIDLPGIRPVEGKQKPYAGFSKTLKSQFGFSNDTIHYFGMVLGLGFSEQEIINVIPQALKQIEKHASQMRFDNEDAKILKSLGLPETPYYTVCTEAAYGATRAENRRWPIEHFWQAIQKICEELSPQTQYKVVLLGLETIEAVPENLSPFVVDLRQKLSLTQTAFVQKQAVFHLGNDSGLLHLANLMQVKTVGIYLTTQASYYGPIFSQNNTAIQSPQTVQEVVEQIQNVVLYQTQAIG